MGHIETLLEDNIKTNRALLDIQRARIPKYLTQAKLYNTSALSINFQYHTQAQVLIRVTTILIVVGSPASLVIGDRTIPVNGFAALYLGEEGMLIRPEDQITLTQNTLGPIGLEFLGEEMGDRGKRW